MNILTGEHPLSLESSDGGALHGNNVVLLQQAKGGAVWEGTPCN